MRSNSTGLFIIRAWLEEGSSKPLRVQMRRTKDVAAGIEDEMVVTDAEGVQAAVENWLLDILTANESQVRPSDQSSTLSAPQPQRTPESPG